MANEVVLLTTFPQASVASGLTRYHPLAQGKLEGDNLEARIAVKYRTAGTLSHLMAYKIGGDRPGASIRVRKNGGYGNQIVTFTSVNGLYEDLTNTDTVADGDLLDYEHYGGSGGTVTDELMHVACVFTSASALTNVFFSNVGRSVSNTTKHYHPLVNAGDATTSTTQEWKVRLPPGVPYVIVKNLYVHCAARTAGECVVTIEGATGAGTAPSVTCNAVADFEDTANQIQAQDGDLLVISTQGASSPSGITINQVKVEIESPDGVWHLVASHNASGAAVALANNNSAPLSGMIFGVSAEASAQVKFPWSGAVASLLTAYVETSGLTALTLRGNAGDVGSPSAVSVPTTGTGWVTDTTNDYAIGVDDLLDVRVTGSSGTCTFQTIALTVQNAPSTFALDVTVDGCGAVTSEPAGIDCPGDCSETYDADTEVTLTATPDDCCYLVEWSGDGSGDPRVVTMDADKAVTATFAAKPVLTVTVVGNGTVTSSPAGIDCPSDCDECYDPDTEVVLTAEAGPGCTFEGWTGDGTGVEERTVTMDGDHAVTATFDCPASDSLPGGAPLNKTLGCGIWSVDIAERGGHVLLDAKAVSGSMGRRLDDMSFGTAGFLIGDVEPHCLGVLAKLKAYQYEMVLLRDGEETWVGPISDSVGFTFDTITISCRDLFQWYERRVHPLGRDRTADLCDVFEQYATDAMLYDSSPNIAIDKELCGIVERRTVLESDKRYVADSLRELGDDGVDWTMFKRTLRLRGIGQGDVIGRLLETHVEQASVQVTKDGLGVASEWIVTGETPDGLSVAVWGAAGGVGAFTGLVQQVSQQELVVTSNGARAAAQALLDVSGEEPMQLSCDLLGTAPFTFDNLIPGNLIDVRMQVGVLLVNEIMLLQSVDVPDLGNEKVGITLSRIGLHNEPIALVRKPSFLTEIMSDDVAWAWMFAEPDGTTVIDYFGSQDGTYESSDPSATYDLAVASPPGRLGGSKRVRFSSAENDYVRAVLATGFVLPAGDLWLEWWFRFTDGAVGGPIGFEVWDGSSNPMYIMTIEEDGTFTAIYSDGTLTGGMGGAPPYELRDGDWHQFVLTVDLDGDKSVYFDGVLFDSDATLINQPAYDFVQVTQAGYFPGEAGSVEYAFAGIGSGAISAARVMAHWDP